MVQCMSTRSGVLCRTVTSGQVAASVVGTVPSTDTWILKSVFVWNQSGNPAGVTVYVTDSGQSVIAVLLNATLQNQNTENWSGWLALAPGDTVRLTTLQANISVWVSGADLPGHL